MVRRDRLARPQPRDDVERLIHALDLLADGRPVGAAGHLVERLARAGAEEHAAGEQLLERHERLRDDGRVVTVHERRDACADRKAGDRLADRAEPDPGVAGLPFGPPRGEVIRAPDAVESGFGGGLCLVQQLRWREHLV